MSTKTVLSLVVKSAGLSVNIQNTITETARSVSANSFNIISLKPTKAMLRVQSYVT